MVNSMVYKAHLQYEIWQGRATPRLHMLTRLGNAPFTDMQRGYLNADPDSCFESALHTHIRHLPSFLTQTGGCIEMKFRKNGMDTDDCDVGRALGATTRKAGEPQATWTTRCFV